MIEEIVKYANNDEENIHILMQKLNELIRWANKCEDFNKVTELVLTEHKSEIRILQTWVELHEQLTLPRFKKELIELFQDEDVRGAIFEACSTPSVQIKIVNQNSKPRRMS